jgi:hypothetical protein
MSSEPDYNFNPPAAAESGSSPLLLPFTLLVAAIAVLMTAQAVNTFKAHSALRDGLTKLTKYYQDREVLVKQSQDLQQKLQTLVLDLLLLAKGGDKDAEQIIAKYHIQQNAPAGAPETAPAPAVEAPK